MDFGEAIRALKRGDKVARAGWNGKGMWLSFVPLDEWDTADDLETSPDNIGNRGMLPFILMRTAQGDFVPWLASQTDMLAEDWEWVT